MGISDGKRFGGRLALAASVAVAAGLAPSAVGAQDQEEQPAWIKVCNPDPDTGMQGCLVVQQLFTSNGIFIASADIRWLEGGDQIVFVAAVRPGMLLTPGVRVQIDDDEPMDIPYEVCYDSPLDRCYARVEVDEAFVDRLKAGGQVNLLTISYDDGQTLSFPMTLAGFTAAYDGEPTDADAAEAALTENQETADAARQRLIDLQQEAQ